jgi:hypothetical protein
MGEKLPNLVTLICLSWTCREIWEQNKMWTDVESEQSDPMSLWKKWPKISPNLFFVKIIK